MTERVAAFWCRIPSRPNFGDALTPWLIQRITGRPPYFVPPEDPRPKYLVTGSVIRHAGAGCTVWGSGILDRMDRISPRATLRAVRGPLTRARAVECGADCPDVLGDPALLLPRFYAPPPGPRAGVGVVPHMSDRPRLDGWPPSSGLRLIEVQQPIERFIAEIVSCEVVASSSLHGLIAAHAYGVSAAWLKFRDLPSGDDSKFHDYFLSRGIEPPEPLQVTDGHLDPDRLRDRAILPGPMDLESLWRACPFVSRP